jgi:hypothetical protein
LNRRNVLGSTASTFKHAFGAKGEVDPINHLIGTAIGWCGNPDKDATYLAVTPAKNDGTTIYKLRVRTCRSKPSGRSVFTTPKATS